MDEREFKDLEKRMKKAMEALKEEMSSLRTGRANTGLVEHLVVEAYGSPMPINQLASLSVPEPRLITIQPWDKGTAKAIEKAIRDSDLGLNPASDGGVIRVPLPELTEQRRKDLVKVLHKYGEQAKVAIRNVRRDGIDYFKLAEKEKEISQDDLRTAEKHIQEITDKYVKQVDEAIQHKEADIMQV